MNWYWMLYTLPLLAGTIICSVLVVLTMIRRPTSGAVNFILLMLALAEWSLTYALELNSASIVAKIFWAKTEYFGIIIIPVAWITLAIEYNSYHRWLKPRNVFLLILIPVVTFFLVWTNDLHLLMWRSVVLNHRTYFNVLSFSHGIWFWVHMGYSYLLLLFGTLLFIFSLIHFPHLYKVKVSTLIMGLSLPWIANIFYLFQKPLLNYFDFTPFAFIISGLILAKGFSHFNLLEVVPVARYVVVENMSDLVMVIDLQNRLVDLNPAALEFISHATLEVIGQPIERVLAAWPELLKNYQDDREIEVTFVEDTAARYFDYRVSSLHNHRGRLTGRLMILRDITERKRVDQLQSSLGQLQKAMEETIQAMALIVEMKDSYTAGHQRRVAKIARAIGAKMMLPEPELEAINLAATVHDIGKINIPTEILNKPSRLTAIEFEIIKLHPEVGYNILKTIEFPWPIAFIVRQHHERINGSGYPLGLSADDILLAAKIIAVADVVESMSNDRPYRPALGVKKALEEISRNSGILYDRQVVEICIELLTKENYDFELTLIKEAL